MLDYRLRNHGKNHHQHQRRAGRDRHLLASRQGRRHRLSIRPDRARSAVDANGRGHRRTDSSRVPQSGGGGARGRRKPGRYREGADLSHRPGPLRQGERNHGRVFSAALSRARGGRRRVVAARCIDRSRRGARPVALSAKAKVKAVEGAPSFDTADRQLLAALPPAAAAKLAKLGIARDFDLVLHLPLRYEDETRLTPIAAARHGVPVVVEAEVIGTEVMFRPRRQLVSRLRDDSGALLYARFLNFYPSQQQSLAPGKRVRLYGEVRPGFFGAEMVHPRFRVLRGEEPLPDALTPVYPTTAGLPQWQLRKYIEQALRQLPLDETLPQPMRERLGLAPF